MNQFHRVLVSFDHQRVVKELTEAGALFSEPEKRVAELLEGNDRHINIGHFDFKQSPYLLSWLSERGLSPDRMSVFVSKPLESPTIWHKDGPKPMAAINVPWFGTAGTFTEWCPDSDLIEHVVLREDKSIQRIEGEGYVVPAERVELHNKAIALSVSAFHRVFPTRASALRGILSIRFPNGFHYRELSEILQKYDDK